MRSQDVFQALSQYPDLNTTRAEEHTGESHQSGQIPYEQVQWLQGFLQLHAFRYFNP